MQVEKKLSIELEKKEEEKKVSAPGKSPKKGEVFKKKFGYSFSLLRAMKNQEREKDYEGKYNVITLEEYRKIRKGKKKKLKALQKEKHSTAKALRGAKVEKTEKKKKKEAVNSKIK